MCGIAGFISKERNSLPVSVIADLTRLIEHRGPDDEGFMCLMPDNRLITAGGKRTDPDVWVTPTEYRPVNRINEINELQAVMAFGHRRLSILDLSPSGHQPMSYKNGRYWIVFNGEIYNYLELKAELEKCGNQFKTNSDTETILAAYSEWGESFLDRLVGMWSFAIFDKDTNEVFLARDRYGIKPLYYYFSPKGDFFFASEIKQFTKIAGWRPMINRQRAYDQLVYSFTDHTDETMFAGVFQIPGGCFFKSTLTTIKAEQNGKIKFTHWYHIKREPFKGSFTDATSIFKVLFERSVKEHMHADVPVGTALSGGLDSSSIVCEVNRILHATSNELLQKTFSSCSTYERFSEKKWMDIVISHTKVNAFFVFPRLEEVIALTPDIIWHHDEPYQSQSAFLAYNLFKLAQTNDVKVLLNGQGADEYLGGYGQFTIARYAEMVRKFRILSMLKDLTKSQGINNLSKAKLFSDIARHLLPTTLKRIFIKAKSSSDRVKRIIDFKKLGVTSLHPYDSNSSALWDSA